MCKRAIWTKCVVELATRLGRCIAPSQPIEFKRIIEVLFLLRNGFNRRVVTVGSGPQEALLEIALRETFLYCHGVLADQNPLGPGTQSTRSRTFAA
jgi:hypothetical protein